MWASSAERAKELPQVSRQQLGFLRRSEVTTPRHVRPSLHVISALHPRTRRKQDLLRESSNRTRDRHALTLAQLQRGLTPLIVKSEGRRDGLCHPIERHVGK